MKYEFDLTVSISGNATEEEVSEFIKFSLGIGGCSQENPLISDDGDAAIEDVDLL